MAERRFDALSPGVLADYGWDAEVAARLQALGTGGPSPSIQPARVVRVDRGAVLAALPHGLGHLPVHARLGQAPVTGDWALVTGEPAALAHVAPRRSVLSRRDRTGAQVLAANVDDVLVVCGLDRPPVLARLDRALVLAWDGGARPAVVLAKADLDSGVAATVGRLAAALPGVEVVATSCRDGRGIDSLRGRLRAGRTVALLGESGVGKSTLANALAGRPEQATGDVRARDRLGRHTTRSRYLLPVGGGATVLDTPGVRVFGILGCHAGLARAFADVAGLDGCRFTDCDHDGEPGCAVTAAVAAGRLPAGRLERYRRLAAEVAAGPSPRRPGRRRGASGRR